MAQSKPRYPSLDVWLKYGGRRYHDNVTTLTVAKTFVKDKPLLEMFVKGLTERHKMTVDDLVKDGWHYSGGLMSPNNNSYAISHNQSHYRYLQSMMMSGGRDFMFWFNVMSVRDEEDNYCVCGHKIKNLCLIANRDETKVLIVGICCIHQLDDYFGTDMFKAKCTVCGVRKLKVCSKHGMCVQCRAKKCLHCGVKRSLNAITLTCYKCVVDKGAHQRVFASVMNELSLLHTFDEASQSRTKFEQVQTSLMNYEAVLVELKAHVRKIRPTIKSVVGHTCKGCHATISSLVTYCAWCTTSSNTVRGVYIRNPRAPTYNVNRCDCCGVGIPSNHVYCSMCYITPSKVNRCIRCRKMIRHKYEVCYMCYSSVR